MDVLIAWVAFPLVLVLAGAGLGLLVERLAGLRLAGALVVPLGIAALMALATLTTAWSATAPLTTPLVVALALAGLLAGRGRLAPRALDLPALLAAVGVFAVLGAPVFLSGHATFAGYTVLGDTAVHLVSIDRLLEHGRSLAGLHASSYRSAVQSYYDSGYPMGSQVALGALRPLVGQDVAWVYQPYLALLGACLSLSLYALTARLVAPRWARGLVAFLAAQPALVMGYALQGSIKELATAALVVLLVALLEPLLAERQGARAGIPLAVASAAAVAAIGPAVAPWLAPILLAALVVAVRVRTSWSAVARPAGVYAGVALALSIPAIALLGSYASVTGSVITSGGEFGNLLGRLDPLQTLGIWLSGDYRLAPTAVYGGIDAHAATDALIAVAIASALLGLAWAVRRRAGLVLLYVAVSAIACAYVARAGSPWAEGKAFMIVSPAALLAVLLGPAALLAARRPPARALAALLALALGGGVLASNVLAYHDASLAPRDRLSELARIGTREAGRGPTLLTEFEEFGKHFLRATDPTGVSETGSPGLAATRPGGAPVRFGYGSDLDDLTPAFVQRFRTLVVRRSPLASRPPADYRLVFSGRWYDVWERTGAGAAVPAHLPLGSPLSPSAVPRCADVAALARRARAARGRLAFVPRLPPVSFAPARAPVRPASWHSDGGDPSSLDVVRGGSVAGTLRLAAAGRFALWLGGSFGRPFELTIDGRRIARAGVGLSGRGEYVELRAAVALAAGDHAVRIARVGGALGPGSGDGASRRLGPLVAAPAAPREAPAVRHVAPRGWRSLCGRTLDWVEVVRG
jgi:hypothetical protein